MEGCRKPVLGVWCVASGIMCTMPLKTNLDGDGDDNVDDGDDDRTMLMTTMLMKTMMLTMTIILTMMMKITTTTFEYGY